MDNLNKLRLLAGVPVRYTPTPKQTLVESPKSPVRVSSPVDAATQRKQLEILMTAATHAHKALNALLDYPQMDYHDKELRYAVDGLQSILDGEEDRPGLYNLAQWHKRDLRKKKVAEAFEIDPPAEDDEHIQDPSEFAELSADADAAAYGEMGGEEDVTSPEVVAKIAAYAKEAGFGAAEQDEFADATDADQVGDDRVLDDLGDEELDPRDGDEFDGGVAGDQDEFADDEFDGPADPLAGEDPGAADMEDPGYGEDDGEFAEFDESAPAITDKNESPNQLDHLEPSPTDDHDRKVTVPAALKTALRDQAATARKEAKELGVADKDAKWFYENLAKMFEELLGHLEKGTVLDIKKAQIFMSSLMGPMLHKIPAEVVSFVAKGGADRTLKDYMKPVDKKYPVTGKMYKGE